MTGLGQIQGQRHLDIRMHLRSRFYYPSRTPDEELVPAGGTDFETLFWVRDKAFAGPSRLVLPRAMHCLFFSKKTSLFERFSYRTVRQ